MSSKFFGNKTKDNSLDKRASWVSLKKPITCT